MRQHVEREVSELHRFFLGWFRGEEESLERVERALAPGFVQISHRGEVVPREVLLEELRKMRGCRRGDDFEIEVREVQIRAVEFGLALVTYEEWQRLDERRAGRISTALMRVDSHAPCGVAWLHLHETGL